MEDSKKNFDELYELGLAWVKQCEDKLENLEKQNEDYRKLKQGLSGVIAEFEKIGQEVK